MQPDNLEATPAILKEAPLEVPASRSGFAVNPELLEEAADGRPILAAGVYYEDEQISSDRTELFRVNGRKFTVPKVVDPRIAFRMIRAIRKTGNMELAAADAMYDILGEGVIDALADEELDQEELNQVMKAVTKYSMSTFQRAGLGNS